MKEFECLDGRIHARDVRRVCGACAGVENDTRKEALFSLACGADERVAYNALWVFTHFRKGDIMWLASKRDVLIDRLIKTSHAGQKRLLLTLLEELPVNMDDIRSDYLDFCLGKINSTEPYAIRALSLKQAFRQCRYFPELMAELRGEMELMEAGELSPGLRSALRIVRRLDKKMCEQQQG